MLNMTWVGTSSSVISTGAERNGEILLVILFFVGLFEGVN